MRPEPILALEAQLRTAAPGDPNWEVYADWLLEQGDVRGELIRLELRAAATHDPRLDPAIAELRATHGPSWHPRAIALGIDSLEDQHGFVTRLRVTRLSEPDDLEYLAWILDDPQARLLSGLSLSFETHAEHLELIARLPELELSCISHLQIAYAPVGNAAVKALVEVPNLALRSLDLRDTALDDEGLLALLSHPLLDGLERLYLQHNGITALGVAALAERDTLRGLSLLDLRANPIEAAGAKALARSSVLGRLETLRASIHDIEAEGAKALGASSSLPRDIARYWRGVAA